MPEPSFIAPLVPRTAADERWHLRAELRDAAVQAYVHAVPAAAAILVLLRYGAAWLGLVALLGLALGGWKARTNGERPRTGAAPGPLRSPDMPLPPTPYETRLCALLAAQNGQQQFNGVLLGGALLACGDLVRLLSSSAAALPNAPLDIPLLDVFLLLCAIFCGYWGVLGSRYLAARAMVVTDEMPSGVIGH